MQTRNCWLHRFREVSYRPTKEVLKYNQKKWDGIRFKTNAALIKYMYQNKSKPQSLINE